MILRIHDSQGVKLWLTETSSLTHLKEYLQESVKRIDLSIAGIDLAFTHNR